MAKKFVDLNHNDAPSSVSEQDGSALTLTNQVRILYDDAEPAHEVIAAIERAKLRIIRLLQS